MLIDQVKVEVKAGRGGNGCNSFFGKRGRPRIKPSGGPGGKGGNIVMVVSSHMQTLRDFKFRQHFKAQGGGHGSSNNKKGRNGADFIIKVPPGTIITDIDSQCRLGDLKDTFDSLVVARGGRGGRGNIHSKIASLGEEGETKILQLDLKLIADVGIVGFPNSGKSTLVSNISGANSKVADYPFTTKEPILGVVAGEDFSFVAADMPGLIKGAHSGRGLGDKFLRHIERTKLLVHLIDMARGFLGDPLADYLALNEELSLYSPDLAAKVQIIVANKMDLPAADENLARFKKKVKEKILAISALKKQGLEELVEEIRNSL